MSRANGRLDNGTFDTTSYAVSTSGTQIARDVDKMAVEFQNRDASTNLVVSSRSTFAEAVTNKHGRVVAPGEAFSDAISRGPWYLYAENGTITVTVTLSRTPARS